MDARQRGLVCLLGLMVVGCTLVAPAGAQAPEWLGSDEEDSGWVDMDPRVPLVVVMLPRAVAVTCGEVLRVRTVADAASERPTYEFAIERLRGRAGEKDRGGSKGEGVEALCVIHVGLDDLYPDYGV